MAFPDRPEPILWPPYRPVDEPPCLASGRAPVEVTNDGQARMFWCDRPRHDGDQHRAVTDLEAGEALVWAGDPR